MSIFRKEASVEKEKIVERVVLGEPHRARLFKAYTIEIVAGWPYSIPVDKVLGTYLSCKDAFDANPGCSVKEIDGIRVGSEYFACGRLVPVKVTRPKRKAKGAA